MDVCVESHDGDVVRLTAKGRIVADYPTEQAKAVHELLERQGYRAKTLIGLQEAEFIGSSGVSWLLTLHNRLVQAGGKLVIHSVPVLVMEVLQVLRLDRVFSIAEDEGAALVMAQGAKE